MESTYNEEDHVTRDSQQPKPLVGSGAPEIITAVAAVVAAAPAAIQVGGQIKDKVSKK